MVRYQVIHYPSSILEGNEEVGLQKWWRRGQGSLQSHQTVVQTGTLGKSHTQAFSQTTTVRDSQNISAAESETPFPPLALYLWNRLVTLSVGPWTSRHPPSLRKYDAKDWVGENHVSPLEKALLSQYQSTWKNMHSERWSIDPQDLLENVQEAQCLGLQLWRYLQEDLPT